MNVRIFVSLAGLLLMCGVAKGQSTRQESASVCTSIPQDTLLFHFAPTEHPIFRSNYKKNAAAIRSLSTWIRTYRSQIETGDLKLRVTGFCNSQATPSQNLATAKELSNQVKSYFIIHEEMREAYFHTTNHPTSWPGTRDIVTAVRLVPGEKATAALMPAPQPETPASRPVAEAEPIAEAPAEEPVEEPAPSAPVATQEAATDPVDSPAAVLASDQTPSRYTWAIKTNVAYLAATVANLGVEFGFGDHYSIDLPVIYSPYTVARDYRLRFLAIQPEFRYWLDRPMKGHFFGVHLNIGAFNIAVDNQTRYQSPDGFYGAGISYGYMLPFARHWAAEFTIGAGYVHTEYDAYYNIPNGARFEKGVPYDYWGLTKVGIGLVYKFGK